MSKSGTSPYGLYLDIQTTQHLMYHRRGIPRFACGQAIALMKYSGLICGIGINPLRPFPEYLDAELLDSPLLQWTTMQSYREASRRGRPLVYYSTSPFELGPQAESLFPPFAMRPEVPLVATLYDLIPMMRPKYYLGDPDLYKGYFTRLETLRQADLVLTISEHTRRDAIELLELDPRRLHTIGAGVSRYFRPPAVGETPGTLVRRDVPGLRKPFVLTVSGAEERKNTEGLIEAFSLLPGDLRSDLQLAVVCKLNPEYLAAWEAVVARHGLAPDDVVFTDLVPDETLRALYQTAQLFVFPSLYEGFGLPAAEAAACGCPTITSDTSSMPEILDFPPATFDPSDPARIAERVERGLVDVDFAAELRRVAAEAADKHTWDAVGARTVQALANLTEPRNRTSNEPARLRLALAGPFPPTRSGIADYNLRLAEELSAICDLDLLVSVGRADRAEVPRLPGVRVFSLDTLGKALNPGSYDAILYSIGNNAHHHTTYKMALRYPGVVWLHDTQLAGMYLSYAGARLRDKPAAPFLAAKLDQMYRERIPYDLLDHPVRSLEDYVERGVGLTAELIAHSRAAIVHSEAARRSVELDLGPFARPAPLTVLPLAVPACMHEGGRAPNDPPVIGSFGIIGRHKTPELLIDALARVRQDRPARLSFVGPSDEPGLLEDLRRRCEAAGVAGYVEFTGDVEPAEYHRRLASADLAVQVRRGTHGESSAAINDCLAAGVPVITNSIACRELPAGTVEMIDAVPTVATIAGGVANLLDSPERRAARAAKGAEYAAQNSFGALCDRLIQLVTGLESACRAG